jgi:tRNA-specific 2-thiouridylase
MSAALLPGRTPRGLTAVAMSGGLDSSVTAWLLAREGLPVVGLSMLLWDRSDDNAHGRCCGALDLGDARRVAQQAGIPHYTLRMDQEFRDKVVDPFVEDYLAGRTPSPCVRCNTWIKFDLLLERARKLGASRVATGHYARILEGPDGPELHTAVDTDKDQSYYLFELTADQLAASLFPLGELTKPEVRDKVVDPFVDDYLAGRTPSPCVRCNTWIKFDLLLERARRLGAVRVATGHYARILQGPEGPELHTALDAGKDQSYYLFELTAEQLAASLFPLGELTKPEVREMAREAGLVVAEKGESMEVCFVAGGIREFVEAEAAANPERFARPDLPALAEPAVLVDAEGSELGAGQPFYRYTVGQRRGLGLAAPSPLYVLRIEPEQNRVVVGGEDALMSPGLKGERLHWIGPPPAELAAEGGVEVTVKIRSRHPGVAARVRPLGGGRAEVDFASPQRGVTPGQAAVFYRGTRVLGGCWIESGL